MGEQLIESLVSPFNFELYRNTYNKELLKIIRQKAEGEKRIKKQISVSPSEASDLIAILKASLEKGSIPPN
ncbi:Ku family protein [Elizabethkingia ursingii]|uniref:hypothetical protein n=1 Tax=Elizabethkingia ursingii TaxID=1756150 RepID=UPI0012FF55EC|nr:hypothetical protein [Elizabethkingia ursingii]